MTCPHAWTPTPADAMSALALVGRTTCLRCKKTATREDMEAFGHRVVVDPARGEVRHDYDALGR